MQKEEKTNGPKNGRGKKGKNENIKKTPCHSASMAGCLPGCLPWLPGWLPACLSACLPACWLDGWAFFYVFLFPFFSSSVFRTICFFPLFACVFTSFFLFFLFFLFLGWLSPVGRWSWWVMICEERHYGRWARFELLIDHTPPPKLI